uniref:EGF-like domain-containing protein n=1 Tax=Plectus sambesii TaxID=2011161 RepID=A0A914XLJ5_9BILA
MTTGCICPKQWTGPNCNETACVHGQLADQKNKSVNSNINRYCQCNAGWTGERCEKRLTKKCSSRGTLINSTCVCNQFYAGESCRLVAKCNNGDHLNGLCTCHKGWTGDFCDKIICQQNGTLNVAANNTVCVCHPQYTGQFCDSCFFNNTAPYPECQELFLPTSTTHIGHHALDFLRKKVFLSLSVAVILIGIIMIFIVALMCVFFGLTKRQARIARQAEIDQREEVRMQLKAKKAEDD